jgi:lipopolysaccharide cholinephosphotransferase
MSELSFDLEYKRILLDTFRFLVDYLNQKQLRWWVAYGTAIGTVRHHGLIPWDDDIDIWMPREDYEKLISLKQDMIERSNGHYGVGHAKTDFDYATRFAKVMDLTTSVQAKRYIPSVKGVWVDVFPLDSATENNSLIRQKRNEVNTLWSQYFEYFKHYCFSDLKEMQYSKKAIINAFKTNLRVNKNKQEQLRQNAILCDEQASLCSFNDGVYCYCIYGYGIERSIFLKEDFTDYCLMPYEDFMVRIPIGYDRILKQLYGDYMTPPPVENRIPRHMPYYINLKERLTVQEIACRVKSGEMLVY